MKFPNLHIVWTAGKTLALPGTLSQNTPPETSPRSECSYAVKTDLEIAQINNLQHFLLDLDCQNNHYEVVFLGNSTCKPTLYSLWIKNNTQQNHVNRKRTRQIYFP